MNLGTASLRWEVLAAGSPAARIFLAFAVAWAGLGSLADAQPLTANWATADFDSWAYLRAPSGTRGTNPSFTEVLDLDQFGQFLPHTKTEPARVGMDLIAFNAIGKVTAGLPPHHYRIHSVTLKVSVEPNGPEPLVYREAPVSNAEMLADVIAENPSAPRPFELYGVAFRSGYSAFSFASIVTPGPELEEKSSVYEADGYVAYPIASHPTQCCSAADVSNNFTGGFSATEPGNSTAPFDVKPWAIGTMDLEPGDLVPVGGDVTFALDLTSTAARQYIQLGLQKGQLGFFLSSLNQTTERGGSGAYPGWLTKEAALLAGATPPRLEVVYELVTPVQGDFDDDGDVDGSDFLMWQCSVGSQLAPGQGPDGSGNGLVETANDYPLWAQHFGTSSSVISALTAVPEPGAWGSLAIAVAAIRIGSCRFRPSQKKAS